MKLENLHMTGGAGDSSYAANSQNQGKVIQKIRPIMDEAITEVHKSLLPEKMVVADLGCSSGPNTFLVLTEVVKIIGKQCRQMGLQLPEMQFFLNDLPGNDFNNIFQSLDSLEKNVRADKDAATVTHFVAGLPGSFYDRLFPIHTDQFKRDFSLFLKLRFKELIPGGQMVLAFLGRTKKDIYNGELSSLWGLVSDSLNSMVLEGLVEEEKLDSFNLPFYAPSMEEAKAVIKEQGLFNIINFHMFELNWDPNDDSDDDFVFDNIQSGANSALCIRSVLEPMIASHFGSTIVDELFSRFAMNVAEHLIKEKTKFPIIVLCLKKKEQI
ncbi:hypothetical protein LUZ61_000369 [Rhynchospora tenuis]|uniref:Uncharacterized protein n=1 Tax=Rhynchospora tenuis TaxID=198213 RepID=A0AAD5ZEW4_9POAL|nr:hypothetical protein LUZ61_000369 [Rhynchospora tenuis]